MRHPSIVPLLLAILAALACRAGTAAAAETTPFAWVQLVLDGVVVRAATSLSHGPSLTVDGRLAAMQPRAPADANYTLTLCQLMLPQGARKVSLGGTLLPLPKGPPQRILVFGDTGCRVKEGLVQACNDPRGWPFAQVVRRAAAHHPDLVIHVGDYYYRESPCPPGERQCAGSPFGDNWATWRAEFFAPAQPLLKTAPWVFARGNHEACERGGRGWFRLLDAGPTPRTCLPGDQPVVQDRPGRLHPTSSTAPTPSTATTSHRWSSGSRTS